jgi:hypothetical protein
MTIFDILKTILEKNKDLQDENFEDLKEFNPYMIQRWISMHSDLYASLLNESSNRTWKVLDDKDAWYKFYMSIIPKSKNKKINYIKKGTKEKSKTIEKELIEHIAGIYEISQKEALLYIEFGEVDIKLLKKILKKETV